MKLLVLISFKKEISVITTILVMYNIIVGVLALEKFIQNRMLKSDLVNRKG